MHRDLAEYGPVSVPGDPNALCDRRLVFDSEIDPGMATPRQRYEAVVRSPRDVFALRWLRAKKTPYKLDPKRAYHLFMEFMIGLLWHATLRICRAIRRCSRLAAKRTSTGGISWIRTGMPAWGTEAWAVWPPVWSSRWPSWSCRPWSTASVTSTAYTSGRFEITLLLMLLASTPAASQERAMESVVPALAFGTACSSTVTMQNLSDRPVVVDVEAHRASGALAPIVGHPEIAIRLGPRERSNCKPQIEEETEGAWMKVRERVPAPGLSPVVAISGATECLIGDQLRIVDREVVYPMRNPWFSGDVTDLPGSLVSLINTTERAVKASACYSSGGFFSTPTGTPASAELTPICTTSFEVHIPPFGAREFPVARDGSSHFALKTQGSAIVLEMLRPVGASVKMYKVDSTIQFGSEVPPAPAKR